MYDKLLKPRQSFRITLYINILELGVIRTQDSSAQTVENSLIRTMHEYYDQQLTDRSVK